MAKNYPKEVLVEKMTLTHKANSEGEIVTDFLTGKRPMFEKLALYENMMDPFLSGAVLINDKDCDNFVKFMDKSAFLLGHKMSMMVQAFNNTVISTLETNKSTATAANLPDDVTVDATTGEYTITSTASKDFWTGLGAADTLAIFDQLARVKGLPNNYYIISGKHL